MVEEMRLDRGKTLPDWPDWCFLPMAAWYTIVSQDNYDRLDAGLRLPPDLIPDVGSLAALGTWRYSQGIYRLDPDFADAINSTTLNGDIPADVIYRMPEWCVYIETPDTTWLGWPLRGFWAHLENDMNTGRHELRLLIDTETDGLFPLALHLGKWSLFESLQRTMAETNYQRARHGMSLALADEQEITSAADQTAPLLSMLLYICSEQPDIDDERTPGTSPRRPEYVKTKRGPRLFPAEKPRIWTVGRQIGEQLRQQSSTDDISQATGRTVRKHLRRGHWHGYWTGPRDQDQKFIIKWQPPIFVGGT
jgi:hypothetical protein